MNIKDFGITIQTLLARDALAQARLLVGESGLGRVVTSVTTITPAKRIPPATQGELFLAEQPLPKSTLPLLADVLREMSGAGAAGLGLVPGSTPPAAALQTADQLGLPLFELPAGIPAAQVANHVLSSILENQTQILDKIQDLNQALTSTMLHGGNLQEICKIIYQRFGNSVAISSDFLSSYVLNTTEDKRLDICAILEQEKHNAFMGRQAPPNGVTRGADELNGQNCERLVVPIYSDSILHGRIYMWQDFRSISGVELSVLESVTSLIALDMMKKMSVLQIENSNRGGFLGDLLSGDRRQYQKAMSNARYFDFDPHAGHQVMVLRLRRRRGAGMPVKDMLYQFNTNIISILQPTVRNTVVKIIYANQGDQIILLLESTPGGAACLTQPIADFLDNLFERLRQDGVADMLSIGVGREYKNPGELYKSLAEAKRALASPNSAGVVEYEQTGIYRLLTYEGIQAEAELFCEQLLHPLAAYDRDKDARLLHTLAEYFECGCNLTRLAERMTIHYNTVANRLQKIQDLTGLRLDDASASLNLRVALKIQEMNHHDEPARQ